MYRFSENAVTGNQEDFKPTYVLIGIDCDQTMFLKHENKEPSFMKCLKGLLQVIDSLLVHDISKYKSPLGVVFGSNADDKFDFIKFTDNMVENYFKIKALVAKNFDDIKEEYERSEDLDLGNFLTKCKLVFDSVTVSLHKKIIIFVTDDDIPDVSDEMKFKAIRVAQAFKGQNLYLDLATFAPEFSFEPFYKELLTEAGSIIKREYLRDDVAFADFIDSNIIQRSFAQSVKFYFLKEDTETHIVLAKRSYCKSAFLKYNMHATRDEFQEVLKEFQSKSVDYNETQVKVEFAKDGYVNMEILAAERLKYTNYPCGYTVLYIGERQSKKGYVQQKPALLEFKSGNKVVFNKLWEYAFARERVIVCVKKSRDLNSVFFTEVIPQVINIFVTPPTPIPTTPTKITTKPNIIPKRPV